jgi:hypothetical protein
MTNTACIISSLALTLSIGLGYMKKKWRKIEEIQLITSVMARYVWRERKIEMIHTSSPLYIESSCIKEKLDIYYRLYNYWSIKHHRIFFIMSLFPQLYSSVNDFQQQGGHVRRNTVSQWFFFSLTTINVVFHRSLITKMTDEIWENKHNWQYIKKRKSK